MKANYRAAGHVIKQIRAATKRGPLSRTQKYARASHITQTEIAEKMSIDTSTFSKIERGICRVDRYLAEVVISILQPNLLHEFLIYAFAGLLEIGLMYYYRLPRQFRDTFESMNPEKKSLSELETFAEEQIHLMSVALLPRVMELAKVDTLTLPRLLHKINNLLNAGYRHDHALETVAEIIAEAINVTTCFIYLFDTSRKPHKLILRATNGFPLANCQPLHFELGEGIIGQVGQKGRTMQISDDSAGRHQLVMPVLAFNPEHRPGHRLLGVISVTTETHTFSDDEIMLLELICGQLAANGLSSWLPSQHPGCRFDA